MGGIMLCMESSHLENTNTFMSGNNHTFLCVMNEENLNKREIHRGIFKEKNFYLHHLNYPIQFLILRTNVCHLQVMKVHPLSNSKP